MSLSPELERHLSRFKRLPRIETVWEGAIVFLPAWVDGVAGGPPSRPRAAVWVATAPQLVHFRTGDADADVDAGSALATLCEMGTSAKLAGYRPAALHVTDAELAAALAEALAGCDTSVEIVPHLPALNGCIDLLAEEVGGDDQPGALDAPGVTLDRLRAFAGAAESFFRAAPWRHLDDGDLIEVEAPKAGKGLAFCAVMGSAGQQFGLGFFSSRKRYRDMMAGVEPQILFAQGSEWAIYLSPAWEMPMRDLLEWDRHQLPVAAPTAYPVAIRLDVTRAPLRPDAGRLAYFEGLLRALAETSETQMDSGRWSHEVLTADGPATYVLSLPNLLEHVPAQAAHHANGQTDLFATETGGVFGHEPFGRGAATSGAVEDRFVGEPREEVSAPASTPFLRARDLIVDASDARGRRQVQLIRQALDVCPDFGEAYVLLASRVSSPDERLPLFEQAVATSERAVERVALDDPERAFQLAARTGMLMRARIALADCLRELGRAGDAAGHVQAVLQLDPYDEGDVRYRLLGLLLESHQDAEAEALLTAYDEVSAIWAYAAVLLALRAKDRRQARLRLRDALRANRHVPRYLTGQRDLPDEIPDSYGTGDQDEAATCAFELLDAWTDTPGASAWLRSETRGRK